jgi:hypothetical protein
MVIPSSLDFRGICLPAVRPPGWGVFKRLAATLGALMLVTSGCSSGRPSSKPPSTALVPRPSANVSLTPPSGISSQEQTAFDGFLGLVSQVLSAEQPGAFNCPLPPPAPVIAIKSTSDVGSAKPTLTVCPAPALVPDPANANVRLFAVVFRNDGKVPVRIGLPPVNVLVSVNPGEVRTVPLPSNPVKGTTYRWKYEIDSDGIVYAAVSQYISKFTQPQTPAVISAVQCVANATATCVLDLVSKILPETIVFDGIEIPVKAAASALAKLLKYWPLVKQWDGLANGSASGTVNVTYNSFG